MKKNYVLGLMTVIALSACGKSLHVSEVPNSAGGPPSPIGKVAQVTPPATSAIADTSGALSPFSDFDVTAGLVLPFTDKDSAGGAARMIGSPSFIVKQKDPKAAQEGFVEASNLVFRAVVPFPALNANAPDVTGIKTLTLKLKGVTLFSPVDVGDPDAVKQTQATLANQVLCLVDGKVPVCSGTFSSDQTNINSAFQSVKPDSDVVSTISGLTQSHTFDSQSKGTVDSAIYTSKEVDIDLLKAFNLKGDKDTVQWIYDHSTAYADGFIKFRFALGNNVYAASGNLVVEPILDTKSKWAAPAKAGALKNGASDATTTAQSDPTALDAVAYVEAAMALDETRLAFDAGKETLTKDASDKLSTLADTLNKYVGVLDAIEIVGRADVASSADPSLAKKRANAVIDELLNLKLPAGLMQKDQDPMIASNSACGKDKDGKSIDDCNLDRKVVIRVRFIAASTNADEQAVKAAKTDIESVLTKTFPNPAPVSTK